MLDAAGPLPTTMSSWKSSIAGYRISSTARDRRWISSMNSTSPSSSLVRIAARSPARSSAGPDVTCRWTPISVATMPASVVLPSPGGPANSRWSTAWFRAARRLEDDREVFLELGAGRRTRRGRGAAGPLRPRGRRPSRRRAARRRRARCSDRRIPHARRAPNDFSASRSSDEASVSPDRSRSTSRTSSVPYPRPVSASRTSATAELCPLPPTAAGASRHGDRQPVASARR